MEWGASSQTHCVGGMGCDRIDCEDAPQMMGRTGSSWSRGEVSSGVLEQVQWWCHYRLCPSWSASESTAGDEDVGAGVLFGRGPQEAGGREGGCPGREEANEKCVCYWTMGTSASGTLWEATRRYFQIVPPEHRILGIDPWWSMVASGCNSSAIPGCPVHRDTSAWASVVLQKAPRQKRGGHGRLGGTVSDAWDLDTQLPPKLEGMKDLLQKWGWHDASLPSSCNSMPSTAVRKLSLMSTAHVSCCSFFLFPLVLAWKEMQSNWLWSDGNAGKSLDSWQPAPSGSCQPRPMLPTGPISPFLIS